MKMKRERYYISAAVVITLSWDAGQAWGGAALIQLTQKSRGVGPIELDSRLWSQDNWLQRREDKKHQRAWAAFSADLSRGDCIMDSLAEDAVVTLPIGQVVSKDEYRLACTGSMEDPTVGTTSIVTGQLVTIDRDNFSVETRIATEAIAPKSGAKRDVSYPAAFFLAMDGQTDKITSVRMYAQNIALLAARGYSMVPDSNNGPIIRPA